MPVSCKSRLFRMVWGRVALGVVLGAAMGLSLAATPALAQTSSPMRLFPQDGSPPPQAGEDTWRAYPQAREDSPPLDPLPEGPQEIREGIMMVDDLGVVGVDSVGILEPGRGGLPLEMWADSSRTVILYGLEAWRGAARSPARQELARRLLLSTATPPPGRSSPALLDLRVEALIRIGATEDAARLAAAAPAAGRSDRLDRALADALLVEGELDRACGLAQDRLSRSEEVYWQKLMVFCHLNAGRSDPAAMMMTMLREMNTGDPSFTWAAEKLSGLRVPALTTLESPTPLTVAMLRRSDVAYPATLLEGAAPWVLRLVARDAEADPALRLEAGERAAAVGALTPLELVAVYEAQPINQARLSRSLADLVAEGNGLAAATLYQVSRRQEVVESRAEVIAKAFDLAEQRGEVPVAALLYADAVAAMEPTPSLMWFAETAGRILYGAGRFQQGQRWLTAAVETAGQSEAAKRARDSLWPFNRLAFETDSDRWTLGQLEDWRAVQVARAGERTTAEPTTHRVARLESRLLTLLLASGDRVSPTDWAPLWAEMQSDGGTAPAVSRMQAAYTAAIEMRMGEATVLALLAFDGIAAGQESNAGLLSLIEALRVVGLDGAARRIALESAVASGL